MYKYAKSTVIASVVNSVFDIVEDAVAALKDAIDGGEIDSYDDVISEAYAQIQDLAEDIPEWTDEDEDQVYDEVMAELQSAGYINQSSGTVTPQG